MADRKVEVDVTAPNLKDLVNESRNLNNELDRAAKPRKIPRAASAALSSDKEQSTGLTRGTAAANTRGDSRDFARQAQGLGGLVHVYATFAANIFAVSSAFNALSKSMDFGIMEKAASILSIRVGTSITNLGKQIQTITDGALSAREALQAASLASTAGLNTKQIQGLTKAAKGASQALGRDMSDSLSRVFKGAVKIEPELLDELGLMIKVDDVNKEYAKTLGKTASALTDFERRQAFVNGVIDQANKKFGYLNDTAVNPFSKLLASVSNLGTTLGVVLSTFLSPFVTALSSSPTALIASMSTLVFLLLKQAIPAIGNLQNAWKASDQAAQEGLKRQKELLEGRKNQILETSSAETKIAQQKFVQSRDEVLSSLKESKGLSNIKGIKDVTALSNFIGVSPEGIKEHGGKISKAIKTEVDRLKKEQDKIVKNLQGKDISSASYDKLVGRQEVIERHLSALSKVESSIEHLVSSATLRAVSEGSIIKTDAQIRDLTKNINKYEKAGQRMSVIRSAVNTTETIGMRAGFAQLKDSMAGVTDETGNIIRVFSTAEKISVGFRGALSILTVGISRLLGALSLWGAVISAILIAGKAFTDWMEWTDDSISKLGTQIDAVADSTKSLVDADKMISKSKSFGDYSDLVIGKIKLQSEAFTNLIDILKDYSNEMSKTGSKGSLSRFWERSMSTIGFGTADDITKNATKLFGTLSPLQQRDITGQSRPEFQSEYFKESLSNILDLVNSSDKPSQQKGNKLLKELNDNLLKVTTISETTGESFAKLGASQKVVSDNAKEYITNLVSQNKEYTSANELLTQKSSLFSVLSDTSTAAESAGLSYIALGNNVKSLANTQFQAYTKMSSATSGYFNKLSTDLDNIFKTTIEGSDNRKAALKSLFDKEGGSIVVATKISNELTRAAKEVYKLGDVVNSRKIRESNLGVAKGDFESLMSYIGAGNLASTKEATIRFQDSLIDIQIESLLVQKNILEASQTSAIKGFRDYYTAIQNTTGAANLPELSAKADNTEEIKKAIFDNLKFISNLPQGDKRSVLEGRLFAILDKLSALESSTLATKGQKSSITTEIYTKRQEKQSTRSRTLDILSAERDTEKRVTDLNNKLEDSYTALELFAKETELTKDDISTFGRELFNIEKEYKTKQLDLTRQIALLSKDKERIRAAPGLSVAQEAYNSAIISGTYKDLEKNLTLLNLGGTGADSLSTAQKDAARAYGIARDAVNGASQELSELDIQINTLNNSTELFREQFNKTIRDLQNNKIDEIINNFSGSISSVVSIFKTNLELSLANPAKSGQSKDLLDTISSLNKINKQFITLEGDRKSKEYKKVIDSSTTTDIEKIDAKQKLLNLEKEVASNLINVYTEEENIYKQRRTLAMQSAENAANIFDKENGMFSESNMRASAEVFITKLEEGMVNFKSAMEQIAVGFAESLDKSVDMFTELLQKSELTLKGFITGVRSILSDMFRQIGSSFLKQALFNPLINKLKNMYPGLKSDSERLQDKLISVQEGLSDRVKDLKETIERLLLRLPADWVAPSEPAGAVSPVSAVSTDTLPNIPNVSDPITTEFDSLAISSHLLDSAMGKGNITLPVEPIQLSPLPPIPEIAVTNLDASAMALEKALMDIDKYLSKINDTALNLTGNVNAGPILNYGLYNAATSPFIGDTKSILPSNTTGSMLTDPSTEALANTINTTTNSFSAINNEATSLPGNFTALSIRLNSFRSTLDAISTTKLPATEPSSVIQPDPNLNILKETTDGNNIAANNNILASKGSKEAAGMMTQAAHDMLFANKSLGDVLGNFATRFGTKAVDKGMDYLFTNMFSAIGFAFANGGIMGSNGSIPLRAYSTGGIADSPQLALFGEGRKNEAYVPLPDNRSIPVTLSGQTGGTVSGDTNINIEVNVTNGNANTSVTAEQATNFSKSLSASIKATVQEELLKQMKPRGLLYG